MFEIDLTEIYPASGRTNDIIEGADFLGPFIQIQDQINTMAGFNDITTLTAGENLAERANVYLNLTDAKWYLIDTNANPPACGTIRGVIVEDGGILSGATGRVRRAGPVDGYTGLTPGALVYAYTTAGGYTQIKPTVSAGGGQVALVEMGLAVSATEVLVLTGRPVQYLKRESLADIETLTIEHHIDAFAHGRRVAAGISVTPAGISVETYDSANQDWDVRLQAAGAGATESSGAQTGTNRIIGDTGGTDYWSAQSFQVTAGRLSQFTFTLGANDGTPAGDLVWLITADDAGKPGSTLVSGSIANGSVTASAQNTVTIDNGPLLAAATTYWLVLHSSVSEATNVGWRWQAAGTGSYANGSFSRSTNSGSSWSGTTADATFTVTTAAEGKSKLAQSFQLSADADVGSFKLWLKKAEAPPGDLTVKIQADSGGDPDGTAITNGTSGVVAASTLSTGFGWITFTFSTPPTLSGNTPYWLVLETTDSASASDYVVWGADGSSPGYASGEMKNYIAAWAAESKDACFDVLIPGTTYEEPCSIMRWSSMSTEFDISVRYDDGSGANGDINTTFKNVSGSTLDVTCVVSLE